MQTPTPPPPEETVWNGSPSQWLNANTYLLAIVEAVVLLGIAVYLQAGSLPSSLDFLAANRGTALLVALVLLIVPLYTAVRAYLLTSSIKYQVTTERIISTTGVFSTKTNNLELYRVDDLQVAQPFSLRLLGLGNIDVLTSDRTTPEMTLTGITHSQELRDKMRKYVEACRDRKRTRVLDLEQLH